MGNVVHSIINCVISLFLVKAVRVHDREQPQQPPEGGQGAVEALTVLPGKEQVRE